MSDWSGRKIPELTKLVVEAYGLRCWLCHRPALLGVHHLHPGRLTIDHVLPRSRGGSDDLANLRPAHRRCNLSRGNRLATAAQHGRRAESGRSFFSGEGQGDPPPTERPPRTLQKNREFAPEPRGKARI